MIGYDDFLIKKTKVNYESGFVYDIESLHVFPLQLETIQNAVRLWSNPGELVFSPFAGIGSEGYQAILEGRRFLGIELKREYFDVAVSNLKAAEKQKNAGTFGI